MPMGKECLSLQLHSHYQDLRDSRQVTYTRAQMRDMLYAFGRPLVPLWADEELYESVDEFLDSIEL